jgi:hypothetical protein
MLQLITLVTMPLNGFENYMRAYASFRAIAINISRKRQKLAQKGEKIE